MIDSNENRSRRNSACKSPAGFTPPQRVSTANTLVGSPLPASLTPIRADLESAQREPLTPSNILNLQIYDDEQGKEEERESYTRPGSGLREDKTGGQPASSKAPWTSQDLPRSADAIECRFRSRWSRQSKEESATGFIDLGQRFSAKPSPDISPSLSLDPAFPENITLPKAPSMEDGIHEVQQSVTGSPEIAMKDLSGAKL